MTRHPVEALFADEPPDDPRAVGRSTERAAEDGVGLPEAASGAAAGAAVAKAMKQGVIADVYEALADAIAAGETLQTFQEKIEEIAQKKGWLGKASEAQRAWRAKIIYETNLRMHYQAERFKQITQPDLMNFYPYWRYVHGWLREPLVPRPEHVAWDGLIIRADDPWWRTHFPPNGWGCSCGIELLSRGDLEKLGREADAAPDAGTREIVDSETGKVREIPNGIDPGFDVTPVEWMARLPMRAKEAAKKAFDAAERVKGVTIEVRP